MKPVTRQGNQFRRRDATLVLCGKNHLVAQYRGSHVLEKLYAYLRDPTLLTHDVLSPSSGKLGPITEVMGHSSALFKAIPNGI